MLSTFRWTVTYQVSRKQTESSTYISRVAHQVICISATPACWGFGLLCSHSMPREQEEHRFQMTESHSPPSICSQCKVWANTQQLSLALAIHLDMKSRLPAVCEHPQPCSSLHRQPPSRAQPSQAMKNTPQSLSGQEPPVTQHGPGWEMSIWTCVQVGEGSCHPQSRPRGAGWSSQRAVRLLGTEHCWLQAVSATSPGWKIPGKAKPTTHAHTVWELHRTWKPRDQQFLWYRKKRSEKSPQGLFNVPFVVPTHSPLCAHPCSRWKMLLRAPAGPLPPQPNA